MRPRIGVNLLWLTPGRVGGSEQYLARQLLGLVDGADGGDFDIELYCSSAFARVHAGLASGVTTITPPIDRDHRGVRIALEHTWLAARARGVDLMHHGGGTVPIGSPGPTVLTVHDLQFLEFPDFFSLARRQYLQRMMPRSVARADVVATPTEYVRRTVIDTYGSDPDRVVVVPHGIPDLSPPSAEAIAEVQLRYRVADRPYVIYPAITHPHKRHPLAVATIAQRDDLTLVAIGGEGAAEEGLLAAAHRYRVRDRVVRPGRVAASDRDALVAGAVALVFPSAYEGFGAPLVEAMALGTPVVCSDRTAIPEVVGAAATVVSSDDPSDWAAAIDRLREPTQRAEMVAAGADRRRAYTLDVSGEALAAAYRLAVS